MANSKTNKITILSIIIVATITIASCISYYLHIKHIAINTSLSLLNFSKKESVLYPIEVNGKYGFINKTGKEVIPPKFDEAQEFSEGLAAVKVGHKWGYIDSKGNFAIKPKYTYPEDTAYQETGCWDPGSSSEGLIAVYVKKLDLWGFVNHKGEFVIKPRFNTVLGFSNGLSPVSLSGKWGYIDKAGKVIIKPKYEFANNYNEGVAIVNSLKNPKDPYGDFDYLVIDKSGKILSNISLLGYSIRQINSESNIISPFSNGLLPVCNAIGNSGCGYINPYGKVQIAMKYDDASNFEDSVAVVQKNGKYGVINKQGNYIIKPIFNFIQDFAEGLAVAGFDNKSGFIDKTGKFVINPQFDYTDYPFFKNGLIMVGIGNKRGYINKTGKFVWYHIDKAEPEQVQDNSQEQSNISKNTAVDFTPYMQNLQKRIKSNWNPPKGKESKNVVLFFKINKDGSINNLKVQKSSGNQEVDNAALEAVNTSTPLDPLPEAYKGSSVPIEFTFDYNVFDKNGAKQK